MTSNWMSIFATEVEPWENTPDPSLSEILERTQETINRLTDRELVPEVLAQEEVPTKIFFKDGEPTTFDEYDGQYHILGQLRNAVQGMEPGTTGIDPTCFIGQAGMGKTLLAKVTANEIRNYLQQNIAFFEVFPADVDSTEALDEIMRKVVENPACVVFIDEVHDLDGSHALKMYEVLENNRYKFSDTVVPVELPSFTLLSATTDFGKLHPAMRRRWFRHTLEPATPEQILKYVNNRGFPITAGAAKLIVDRTKFSGAPWEAIEMFRLCVPAARARKSERIQLKDVNNVLDYQRIDEVGLRWMDRQVIKALFSLPKIKADGTFVCYAGSEANVVLLAQIDKAEYRETIRPKLMSRGFLGIRPYYGQALTDKAVRDYAHLMPETE